MTNHTKLSKGVAGALNNKVFDVKVLLYTKTHRRGLNYCLN